ncbi:transposable element Tcb2 transposase [Trichonephila clavipes]|nr:transposable element Tcb2 transposase [Trichonephila clavipes]
MLGPVDSRYVIYMKTRLRTSSTDQSSRRPPHRNEFTRIANCFIGRHPGTDSTFIRHPCVFSNHTKVVFSDESRYNLSSDDNRVRVWRPRGERLNPAFALQQHTAPTVSVMVWVAIANNTRSTLVLIFGTKTVQSLSWPARSPGLSPVEHIWDHLGLQFRYPTSLNELEGRLQQIWNEMSQDIIQNLHASMNYRIKSCIRARWSSRGY